MSKLIQVVIKPFGQLFVQVDWSKDETWYYITKADEKLNMNLYAGSFEKEGSKIYQIVIGKLLLTWFWKKNDND